MSTPRAVLGTRKRSPKSYTDIDFDAWDLDPFGMTNKQFANTFCPTIRLAFEVARRDREGVRDLWRGILATHPDAEPMFALLEELRRLILKCHDVGKIAEVAEARLMATGAALGEEETAP